MKTEHGPHLRPWMLLFAGAFLAFSEAAARDAPAEAACDFSPQKAGFSVKIKEENCPYRVMGVFVLPGELLSIEAEGGGEGQQYILDAASGRVTRTQRNHWFYKAPRQTGLYPLVVALASAPEAPPSPSSAPGSAMLPGLIREAEGSVITLNVFVMAPFGEIKDECLRGFRIGRYPSRALKGLSIYEPPRGFIEVTEENQETLISPHFRIGQFLCKQECSCPKYLVLRERLLLKLERILEEFNRRGYCCQTLHIMSGYRTPYYNHLIGNVAYSRHLWGDAADFFIDQDPRDGMMDDLNGDGKINYRDATVLYEIIDEMSERPWYERFLGGLGWYRKTSSHGPFVHVDVRGYRARW
jgi:hypothetical protein